jgi:ABC-type lipoprotein export system ATPase subunit
MVLTVVVGSSGSGKTTFLNHVYEVRGRFPRESRARAGLCGC